MNASTVEIAHLAGVSEGSIFRRFATKEALFHAAIQPPAVPAWVQELERLSGQGEIRDNLKRIVRAILVFAQERIPYAMLSWSQKRSDSRPPDAEEPPIVRDSRRLARFLQQEVDQGRLRPCSVEMVAHLLLGPCLMLVLDSVVHQQPLSAEELDRFTEDLIETLWQGIAPPAAS